MLHEISKAPPGLCLISMEIYVFHSQGFCLAVISSSVLFTREPEQCQRDRDLCVLLKLQYIWQMILLSQKFKEKQPLQQKQQRNIQLVWASCLNRNNVLICTAVTVDVCYSAVSFLLSYSNSRGLLQNFWMSDVKFTFASREAVKQLRIILFFFLEKYRGHIATEPVPFTIFSYSCFRIRHVI